jgi:hypothetical protein
MPFWVIVLAEFATALDFIRPVACQSEQYLNLNPADRQSVWLLPNGSYRRRFLRQVLL